MFIGVPASLEFLTQTYGLAVFVHDNWTSPLSVEPIFVYPNAETNIALSRTQIKKVPEPYSLCRNLNDDDPNNASSSILKDLIKSTGFAYKQSDCIIQCYQKFVIERCNCYDLKFVCYFDNGSVVPCANNTCYSSIYEQFFSSNDFIAQNCMPLCPLECNNTIYTASISMNGYPTPDYQYRMYNTHPVVLDLYSKCIKVFSFLLISIELNVSYLSHLSILYNLVA